MTAETRVRIPGPSTLARKILCPAYVSVPFNDADRFRFQALHAMSVLKVISRHLKMRYMLKLVERGGRGYRIDLLFRDPTGRIRLDEVKSSKKIREVHKIQAALYAMPDVDEIAVSNNQEDQVLTAQFIEGVHERAQHTIALLSNDPRSAATTYTPHEDVCYTCANIACPYNSQASTDTIETSEAN